MPCWADTPPGCVFTQDFYHCWRILHYFCQHTVTVNRAHSPGPSQFVLSLDFFFNACLFSFFLLVFFCLPFPLACFASHKTWFVGKLWQQAGKFKLNSSGWGRHTTHHQIGVFFSAHTNSINLFIFALQSSTHILPHTISPKSSKVLQNFLNVMATTSLHIPQAFVILLAYDGKPATCLYDSTHPGICLSLHAMVSLK